MTLFWIVTGAMALAVSAVFVAALLRSRRESGPAEAFDVQVYRDQLKEIERDLARGVIPAEEADRLRTEVSRRVLTADAEAKQAGSVGATQPRAVSYAVAGLSSAVMIGGAFWVYSQIGAPGYPDLPLQQRIAEAADARENRPSQTDAETGLPTSLDPDVPDETMELIRRLRGVVAERPNDLRGLQFLARYEASIGNYADAYAAQERIVSLKGDDASASDYADLADMMILAAGGYVSPEAQRVIEAAIARDPQNGVARYYAGLMMSQTGRPDVAFRMWDRLLRESPADAAWVPPVRAQIQDMAWRAGVADYEIPEPPDSGLRGPTAEDMENAATLSPEDRLEMVRGMVETLSARLSKDGGSAEEWAQLINALGVIGETDRAGAIWNEARTVFGGSPGDLETVRAAAQRIGLTE